MEIVKSWKHFQKFIKHKLLYLILWFFKYEQRAKFLYYSCILVFTYHAHFIPKKDWVSYHFMLSGHHFPWAPRTIKDLQGYLSTKRASIPQTLPKERTRPWKWEQRGLCCAQRRAREPLGRTEASGRDEGTRRHLQVRDILSSLSHVLTGPFTPVVRASQELFLSAGVARRRNRC